MECAHCLYACKPGKGKHMSLSTFRKAVDIANDYESSITIGGGEPTLHPDLLMMLGYCSLLTSDEYMTPFMVTNGTCDEKTWRVLMRAKHMGNIDVRVSKDPWHDLDMIQDYVWDDCDSQKLWWGNADDRPEYGSHTRTITPRGRAKANLEQLRNDSLNHGYDEFRIDPDSCMDVRVDPHGNVWADIDKPVKVGPLSEDNVSRAMEIISEYENREAA